MSLTKLQQYWNEFGKSDPMWAVLMDPSKRGNRWDKQEFFHTGMSEIEALLNDLKALSPTLEMGNALDFGCGVGRLSQALAVRFKQVHGVDIAPSMITEADKHNQFPRTCHYHLNDTDDLSAFPSNSFDLVYSCRVLQHIEPQYSINYIQEFCRILSPTGSLVFQIPDSPVLAIRLRLGLKSLIPTALLNLVGKKKGGPETLMHCVPRREITQLIERNNLRIVEIKADNSAPGWSSFRYVVAKN